MGKYKCNSDRASKGNPGLSSCAFCIRNDIGNLGYAEGVRIVDTNNLMAEVMALRMGLEHCKRNNLLPVILETDPLALKNILYGIWDTLWNIALEIRIVHHMIKDVDVVVENIFREGNKVADFIANKVFFFAGTSRIIYSNFLELPREAKTFLNMDKNQVPNLRIKKF